MSGETDREIHTTEHAPAQRYLLSDVGHQVVGGTVGVLANSAALVSANGVEVTQKDNLQVLVGNSCNAVDRENRRIWHVDSQNG